MLIPAHPSGQNPNVTSSRRLQTYSYVLSVSIHLEEARRRAEITGKNSPWGKLETLKFLRSCSLGGYRSQQQARTQDQGTTYLNRANDGLNTNVVITGGVVIPENLLWVRLSA